MFDQHTHSAFSYDAPRENTLPRLLEAAIKRGLSGIAVTDHFDPLWPDDTEPSALELPAYEAALQEAEKAYGERIRFAKGIELGLMPGKALGLCEDTVSGFPFDFVLASIHSSPETPIDFAPFHEGRSLADILLEYYTLLRDSIRCYKNYDILGHINGIDRYTNGLAPEALYMPYIDEILRIVISDGKGIEINTSAFRYGIGAHGTPTQPILNRFRELGGELVTIGSDAHRSQDLGAYLKEGEEMLLAAGFCHIAVFKNRQPEFIRL